MPVYVVGVDHLRHTEERRRIVELWDVLDGERRALNRTHERGKPIPPGEYHTVVSVWTVDSRGNILLTLRDPGKEVYPNRWENTGGSALAGETSRQAAVRELAEETGIAASQDELTLLRTLRTGDAFCDYYAIHKDVPLSELTLQPGETVDARYVTLAELDAMIADESLAKPIGEQLALMRAEFLTFFGKKVR